MVRAAVKKRVRDRWHLRFKGALGEWDLAGTELNCTLLIYTKYSGVIMVRDLSILYLYRVTEHMEGRTICSISDGTNTSRNKLGNHRFSRPGT
jgi:hypothetical protein